MPVGTVRVVQVEDRRLANESVPPLPPGKSELPSILVGRPSCDLTVNGMALPRTGIDVAKC